MQKKNLGRVEVKDATKGEIQAVFSTFDQVDHDGDVTLKGAFTDGAPVQISAFNHGSWEGALPVGKGVIRVNGNEAVLDGQFFMDTQHGRDTFATVKAMGDLQEFSYGYNVADSETGTFEGKSVRFLKALDVFEVSPVLKGAGIGTRTLSVKSKTDEDDDTQQLVPAVKRAMPVHETQVVASPWDGSKTCKNLADDCRPSELRTVFAWVDPLGDPEVKSSYKFAHHQGVGGPANIRACLVGIATLNGVKGDPGVPEADRKAVYDHLAAHLRDADREPPALRTAPGDGTKRFGDEASEVMASLSGLIDRATEIMVLRAQKGRGMSPAAADLLSWVGDELKRLNTLLESPVEDDKPQVSDEDMASTILAAVARAQGL